MRFSVVVLAVDSFHFDRKNGNAMPSRKAPKVTFGSGAVAAFALTSPMNPACDPPGILAFLSHLEDHRNNDVSTRNVRLAAIHAFFRFVSFRNPEQLDVAQKVIAVRFKRAPNRAIETIWSTKIDSILAAIDRTTPQSVRNCVLMATMLNTGGRV